MTLLIQCLLAGVLAGLALTFGVVWMRQGGTFVDSEGATQSNFIAGCGTLLFGIIATVAAVLMARDVEARLWGVAVAVVAPLLGLRAAWRAIALEPIERIIDRVRKHLLEGYAPGTLDIRGLSAAHSVVRMPLLIEREAADPDAHGYRSATRGQSEAYLDKVRASIAGTRRQALRPLALGLVPCVSPLLAMLFYAVTTPALEPLGWQVLAGASAVSTACAAAGWWARTQTARAAAGIYEVLAAPEAAGSARSDTSELA